MSSEIVIGKGRTASAPREGALRDALRTLLGFGAAWIVAHFLGAQVAADMSPTIDAGIVIAVSAALAWIGKRSRNASDPLVGKIV